MAMHLQALIAILAIGKGANSHGSALTEAEPPTKQVLHPPQRTSPANLALEEEPAWSKHDHDGTEVSAWARANPAETADTSMVVRPLDDKEISQGNVGDGKAMRSTEAGSIASSRPFDEDEGHMGVGTAGKEEGVESLPSPVSEHSDISKLVFGDSFTVETRAADETRMSKNLDKDQELQTSSPEPPQRKSVRSIFSKENSHTTVIAVLAISAGCTGCGLLIVLVTGIISVSRMIHAALWYRREVGPGLREIPLESFYKAAPEPRRPVVILAPDNGILVGFEVKAAEGYICSNASSMTSTDEFCIDVRPYVPPHSPDMAVLPPQSSASPVFDRSILLSPLGNRGHPRRDWREAQSGVENSSSLAALSQNRSPNSPPLMPPQSPD